MPTIFSHAIAATALGQLYPDRPLPRGFWIWSAVCAMLPDADVIGFRFGIRYDDMLGHRGLSHSLVVAAIVGLVVARVGGGSARAKETSNRDAWDYWRLAAYFAVVTASHGLLDAFTNGGRGIAFLAPFSARRFFFPWTPIEVSPIGLGFLGSRGLAVIHSEIGWIWLPAAAVAVLGRLLVRRRSAAERRAAESD
jgi:inner membrane protein